MLGAQGDVGALVFAHEFLDAVLLDHGRALNHHPVLGPVVVHLQGQAGPRVDHDLFHLPALALGDTVVGAPGPVDAAMGLALRRPLLLQQAHHGLDVLGPVPVGHQHHVIGFDHHQVFHPQPHHQPVLAAQVAVAGALVDHPATQHVAVAVLVRRFPEGTPAAHIAPARLQGNHHPQRGALHHGHVDGHIRAGGEGGGLEAQEVEVGRVLLQGGSAGAQHLRGQALQLRQDGAGAKQEHAAVPGEAAGGEELLGGGPIRLLDEAGDRHRRGRGVPGGEGFGGLDVAVARFRRRWHDAEGHQLAGQGGGHAGGHRGPEALGIANHMVGGEHQQQGVGAAGGGLQGGHRHGRGGVAAARFEQDRRRLGADLAHLLGHDEAVVLVADQQGRRQMRQPLQPLLGLLQQGGVAVAGQGPVLLGITGPR